MPGRTQAERSADTIDALLTATLQTLEDVGYARATTEEICRRAGVSQGALFHHFETRTELVSAAIARHEDVLRRLVEAAAREVDERGWPSEDPVDFLEVFLRRVRHPRNAALFEALIGARTDERLRDDLRSAVERLYDTLRPLMMRHPAFSDLTPHALERWLELFRDYIAGDTIWRAAGAADEPDRRRLRAIVDLARHLAA